MRGIAGKLIVVHLPHHLVHGMHAVAHGRRHMHAALPRWRAMIVAMIAPRERARFSARHWRNLVNQRHGAIKARLERFPVIAFDLNASIRP
jgi:hypothetical protein